jgi:Transglutaminase-like superfamily
MPSRFSESPQAVPPVRSAGMVLRAYVELLLVDMLLARRGFPLVYERVKNSGLRNDRSQGEREVCRSVDLACVFYFKQVRCLQRAAATTILLRNAGVVAEMVIGVRQCPFRSHAWVEVDGRVVNDKPYTPELYAVLDRC